jgi:DNA-binding SARP family transcriptional activator/class 3 adenylate cyclase
MTEGQAPSFTLRVLGGFHLSLSGVSIKIPTRKLACLLTYLACAAPAPQRREKLADLLWGAQGEERARHNLRQALLRLRTLLGYEAITSLGDAVFLTPGAFECDVVRFEDLLAENSLASIAAAADLYGGPLLEDVSVGDLAWNEWLLRERDRLSERAVGAIVAQGESGLTAGDAERAIQCGRRAIAIDNFREDAHRLVLKGLAAAGRNSEALRRYQGLVTLLKAELDAEPDTETRRLAQALGGGSFFPQGSADSAPRSDPPPAAAPQPSAGGQETAWLEGAERRQMTVLVCNVEPAASHPAPADPEDMRAFILAFHQAAADTVASFGGRLIGSPGNAVQALFGYPEAREQDAVQAVRAGMALVQAVEALGVASGGPLRTSVGVAAGLVVVEGSEWGGEPVVIGEAPALARRLQTLAPPGGIVVSRETRPLLAGRFELRPSEAVSPRGATRAFEAWLVYGETDEGGGAEDDTPVPRVGRQEELDLLLRRWEQVRQGEGRVVLLSGEPGIGKSFIAQHLIAALDGDQPAHLRYFCSPHHTMRPFHPYIGQVERSAGLSSAGGAAEKLDRLAALIEPASTDVVRDVALLAELLALPPDERYPARGETPQQKRELVMTAHLQMLEGLAAQRPVVALFEDIHWIDPTSLDLLDRTIARIAHLPVLVIATFRPEFQLAWVGQPHVTLLHLNRLGRRESAALINQVCRDHPPPGPIVDQIIDRADGVPLFLTELSKHLLESGLLNENQEGAAVPGPPPSLSMPMTLQAALSVRLEGLGAAKRLALIGSTIGRQFSRELIAAIVEPDFPQLDEALHRLTASGLVSRRGAPPNATYVFAHVLGRDAAYALNLKNQRRRLHSKIADVLIDRFFAHPEGSPEIVAHHLSQAGRTGEAAVYWVKAGRAAQARWANRECADFFDLALDAIDETARGPETLRQAIDLRFEMKNALIPLGEFDRIIAHLREARILIDQLGDPQRLCQFQVHMCQVLGLSGKSDDAITFGQDAERLARSLGDTRLLVEATVLLAIAHFTVTDYQQAEPLFLQVLQLLETVPRSERFALAGSPQVTARAFLTRIKTLHGEFEQGIRHGETGVREAESLEHPYNLALSIWCLADLHLARGDIAYSVNLLERGLAVSRQWDLPFLAAGYSASLGYAHSLTDRADEGLPLLEQAMGVFEAMRHQLALSLFRVLLGEAYVLGGRLDQASTLARDALKLAQASVQRSGEVGFLRILADISERTGRLEEAEAQYREAGALAEGLGMRPLAARCRQGLASVYARMANQKKARDELAAATAMYRDMGVGFWLGRLDPLDGEGRNGLKVSGRPLPHPLG